jgi:signal peptidase I
VAPATRRASRSAFGSLVEIAVTVAIAIGLAFVVQAFLIKPYKIPTTSMVPTLDVGQRILVWRLDTHPHVGDIVVFHPPVGATFNGNQCGDPQQGPGHAEPCDTHSTSMSEQAFVKRVVGLPGDHLTIRNGHVFRNGVQERGHYIQPCPTPSVCTFSRSITVPSGEYYMMGDNRGISDDSRFWGPVPQRWIIGVAVATYWPLDRIGII